MQAELDQLAHRMRQHVDADAERLQFRHALEHAGGNADLVQAERQRQPANAAAGDENRHDTPSLLWRCHDMGARPWATAKAAAAAGDGRAGVAPLTSRALSERNNNVKLYYAPGTCALASHIALEEAGADYTTERLDFKANQQQSPEYLKINPKGRVPALVTDKGILTETPAILAYIAQSFPKAKLAPLDDAFAFAQVQSINSYLCSTVHVAHAHKGRGYRWATRRILLRRHEAEDPEDHGRLLRPDRARAC